VTVIEGYKLDMVFLNNTRKYLFHIILHCIIKAESEFRIAKMKILKKKRYITLARK